MLTLLLTLAATAQQLTIPAGQFEHGTDTVPDESPRRIVTLQSYQIDAREVSIQEFEQFATAAYHDPQWWHEASIEWHDANPNGAGTDIRAAGRNGNHPVVGVTWHEAEAYCRWRGGSLPTEAQWERAACDGRAQRFPWGDREDVDVVWYSGGKYGHITNVQTRPVQQHDPTLLSPFGAMHMTGNVWEWTTNWYHHTTDEDLTDPTGPEDGTWKVLKGGSFMNLPSYSTCTHREPAAPDRVAFTVGFRCAYSN